MIYEINIATATPLTPKPCSSNKYADTKTIAAQKRLNNNEVHIYPRLTIALPTTAAIDIKMHVIDKTIKGNVLL